MGVEQKETDVEMADAVVEKAETNTEQKTETAAPTEAETETEKEAEKETDTKPEEEKKAEEVNLYGSLSLSDSLPESTADALSLASFSKTLTLHELLSYKFGTKDSQRERDVSPAARMERLQAAYQREGMRRSVEAILLVHEHSHPYVLLLQDASGFRLPGGKVRPGESDVDGLKRKLVAQLGPTIKDYQPEWQVKELLCKWWRPAFEDQMYPYAPPHVTKPKECKKVYLLSLPAKCYFAVPKNLKLLAVPLFDLYGNAGRYGPAIASIPQLLGRIDFMYQ